MLRIRSSRQRLFEPTLRALSTEAASEEKQQQRRRDFGFQNVDYSDHRRLVGDVFKTVAGQYDIMNDFMSAGLHRLWKDRFIKRLAPYPGIRHVDVAGGTGDIAFRILRICERKQKELTLPSGGFENESQPADITVVDASEEMLEAGQSRKGGDQIKWVHGLAEELPIMKESVDSYTISFGLRNVTERENALREAHRVLRKGGRFLCLEFSHVDHAALRQLYNLYSFNVIPAIAQVVVGTNDPYKYLVESIRNFPAREALAKEISDSGFKCVEHSSMSGGIVAIHSGVKL